MGKLESEVQQEIQLEAPKFHCILERNNSGALKDADGRLIFFGLGNVSKKHSDNMKSSDLIGITTIVVTEEMVGRTLGVFTAIEVKKEDWKPKFNDPRESAQRNYINWVIKRGGFAGMINSIDQLCKVLRR